MGAIGGSIRSFGDEETLVAADAAYGAKSNDTEEPIPDRAVGVVERFGVAGGTDLSVREHGGPIGCDVSPV